MKLFKKCKICMPILSGRYWTSMIGLVSNRVIYVAIIADEKTNYEAYILYKSYHVIDFVKFFFDRISTGHSQWTLKLVARLPQLSSYDSGPFALKFMQCCEMGYWSSSFPNVKIERNIIRWEIVMGQAISSLKYHLKIVTICTMR